MSFTHLHLHTSYSLLDGAGKIPEMLKRAKDLGQNSIAITDHGNMYGVIEFFLNALKIGIKPIIGCEVYVTDKSRFEKNVDDERFHLILLCENDIGYKNLIKIVSIGFVEGFYKKPRVDYETLKKYHEGIIALSACLAGEVQKSLVLGDFDNAKIKAENYINIFGKNNFFIEIQNHGLEDELKIHKDLINLSKVLDIGIVATNDVHYTLEEDWFAHDCLLCLQTSTTVKDEKRMKYEGNNYYIKSEEEMLQSFKFCKEAIENTQKIADRCNVHLEFTESTYNDIISKIDENKNSCIIKENEDYSDMIIKCDYHVPKFTVPKEFTNETYLKHIIDLGINKKIKNITKEVLDRVNYEFSIITTMGFTDYFLIVWDYINYAKTHNIPVGPGRGSSVGSIIAYALSITEINPLEYDLLFERFLNPERATMPDIDTDFCVVGRDLVIEYVKNKYGEQNVAQIVTFNTLASRQVVKDVGRVLSVPLNKTTLLAKLIPTKPMPTPLDLMLDKNIDDFTSEDKINVLEFRKLYNTDDEVKTIVDISRKLENIPRQNSIHASGVLIAPTEVTDYVPLCINNKDSVNTEFDMIELEELGMLKMDFLGLRNLTAIKDCINNLKQNKNIILDIKDIPYDDQNVYKMIGSGNTLGVFQLESVGMINFMKKLKPTRLDDLIAGISLYRPGPMDFIPKYIEGKQNIENIRYECDELKDILSTTYGCIVYQEQIMQIVQKLAGFSLGRADNVRKYMSKKKPKALEEERKNFIYGNEKLNISGCIKNGISEDIANNLYDEMVKFGKYAFNKSHATAYAVIAYETAYLKYYYPLEFHTSICNSLINNRDKLKEYVNSLHFENIKIYPPDINKSNEYFSVETDGIRIGFSSLKGVGINVSNDIIKERNKNGKYDDLETTISRLTERNINKKVFENLILSGSFDCFCNNRNQMLYFLFEYLKKKNSNKKSINSSTLLDYFDFDKKEEKEKYTGDFSVIKDIKDFSNEERLFKEKEIIGMFVSDNPLFRYKSYIDKYTNMKSSDLIVNENDEESGNIADGDTVKFVCIINEVKFKMKNTKWATVIAEDLYGEINMVVFDRVLNIKESLFTVNNIVFITGKAQFRNNGTNGEVIVNDIKEIDSAIWIRFKNEDEYEKNIDILNNIFDENIGKGYINIYIEDTKNKINIDKKINVNDNLLKKLYALYSEENVKITYR